MMEKRNVVEVGITPCRYCSRKAVMIDEHGVPRCGEHLEETGVTLKSAAVHLADKHNKE